MSRFWNWVKNEDGVRTLVIDGVIAEESWWGDEVTPAQFKDELNEGDGDIRVYLNSPGGDCVAASRIYTMLMEYPHNIDIVIDGLAASAASVIAMAGTKVIMAPTAMLMIHDPFTEVYGNAEEMYKAIEMLEEFKETIINAYQIKTGLPRDELAEMMSNETWMNAYRALELGFCDEVLNSENENGKSTHFSFDYSGKQTVGALLNKLKEKMPTDIVTDTASHENISIGNGPVTAAAISTDVIMANSITTARISQGNKDTCVVNITEKEDPEIETKITGVSVADIEARLNALYYQV